VMILSSDFSTITSNYKGIGSIENLPIKKKYYERVTPLIFKTFNPSAL
jgi:hypothetical protein